MTKFGLIPDEWIVSYAAGTLSDAKALLVGTHIDYHTGLRNKLADAEALAGVCMESREPTAKMKISFDDLMADIDDGSVGDRVNDASAPHGFDKDLPKVLQDYLRRPLDEMKWRIMGPGMYQCRLANGPKGEKLWLLKARGGTEVPLHDHRGTEMTLVLRGSYHVGDMHFTPGLLELAGSEITGHQPVMDEGEDCICLVVTDGNIKLYSLIGRIVQPFIGL